MQTRLVRDQGSARGRWGLVACLCLAITCGAFAQSATTQPQAPAFQPRKLIPSNAKQQPELTANPFGVPTSPNAGPAAPHGQPPQSPQLPKPTVVLKPGEVPAIKFDNRNYDFGRLRAGQEVRHDFWFTNTGTGPLEITSVRPG